MGDILSVLGHRCLEIGWLDGSSPLYLPSYPLLFLLSRLSPSHLSIPLKSLFLSLSLFSYLFSFLFSVSPVVASLLSPLLFPLLCSLLITLLTHPLVSLNLISPVVYFLIFLSFLPPPLVFSHFLFSPFPGLTSPLTSISPCLSHLFCPPLLHSPPSSFVSSCPSRLPSLLLSGLVNMLIAITSHCCCLISPSLHL